MFVVDVVGDRGVIAADGAVFVATELEGAELHLKRVVLQQTSDEGVAALENDFHRFGGLKGANGARKNTENTGFGARRREVRGRRLGVQAAVARSLARPERRHLAVKAEDRTMNDGNVFPHARVVDEVACREVV